jgi:hypothetical protein
MKRIFVVLIVAAVAVAASSCKRTSVDDPSWNAPAAFYVLLEGSVSPAVQVIDGRIHSSQVYVRVTDYQGNPLAGRSVFFEQLLDQYSDKQVNWGYFQNNQATYQKNTDGNGEIRITFYWPTDYYSEEMWIHAVLIVDGRAYKESETGIIGNIPQDFIPLTMYRSGDAAAPAK